MPRPIPSFDIDGIDTAHKLSMLAALAFGARIDFAGVATHGIRAVELADIDQAAALGFRIKLVGLAENERRHAVPARPPGAGAARSPARRRQSGALNAVTAEGDFVGRLFFQGRGAGEGPTASAVVADLIDIAQGRHGSPFGMPVASLAALPAAAIGNPARPLLSAADRRRSPRRARRTHRGAARPWRIDRKPDPARRPLRAAMRWS